MAVTLTTQKLAYRMRLVADTETALAEPQLSVVNAILDAATALVQRYAPNAPSAIMDEAVSRLAGFMYDTPPSGSRQWQNPMQQSGATALLSGYRVQRATALSDDDNSENRAPRGLVLVADTEVTIFSQGVWTATGVNKPSTPWFAYQIGTIDEITPVLLIAPGSLDQSAVAGDSVDVLGGMQLGCAVSGELMIAHSQTTTITLRVWSVCL